MRRGLLIVAAFWLAIAALLALQFWPLVPNSLLGWVLFVVIGPPLYVIVSILAEWLSGWLFPPKPGAAVLHHPFSIKRVLMALGIGLVVLALCWWFASWLAGTS